MKIIKRNSSHDRRKQDRRLGGHTLESLSALLSSLDFLSEGVIIVDCTGKIILINQYIKSIQGISSNEIKLNESLIFIKKEVHYAFNQFLSTLTEPNKTNNRCDLILNTQPQASIAISCFPLKSSEKEVADKCLLVFHDPQQKNTKWNYFSEHYNITRIEIRLCKALVNGYTLAKYNEEYHVSKNTSRSQLSSIFNKTDTHSQPELLQLISRFTYS